MENPLVFDENKIRELPEFERLAYCENIMKYEKDESVRWDAVWLAGEIAAMAVLSNDKKHLFDRVADLMVWVLENDDNGVVKHEACYQIAARNMQKNISALVKAALHDKSVLTRHEALESLGLMRATEITDVIKDALTDLSIDVRETAHFVIKRLERMKKSRGEYNPSSIL
ncbi:MAG: HEAT repeat domain-containing protein [Nitrosopumilus sp.]|nr:HEAT repeat domain-containing protein [Nitrosopumilus sp.]